MTTRISDGAPLGDEHGRPMDLTTLREDDLLLDRLGRGDDLADADADADADAVAATLARWRATLPGDDAADRTNDELLASALAVLQPSRRIGRVARRAAALSVVAALAFGSLAAASEHAGPDSPLWPLTRLMHHDRVEVRAAADAADAADAGVSAARAAIDANRYDQASRMLDDAAAAVERMEGAADAGRLREEIAALRALIPAGTERTTAGPPARLPSSEVPRSVVPPSPVDSLPSVPTSSTVVPTADSPVPPVGSDPPLVPLPSLPTASLSIIDGPIGLVR